MPGAIGAPGNFDEGKNHEKLSLRHWPDRAVSVEGDFGLEHLGLRCLVRSGSSARYECFGSGAITRSGTGELAPHN